MLGSENGLDYDCPYSATVASLHTKCQIVDGSRVVLYVKFYHEKKMNILKKKIVVLSLRSLLSDWKV